MIVVDLGYYDRTAGRDRGDYFAGERYFHRTVVDNNFRGAAGAQDYVAVGQVQSGLAEAYGRLAVAATRDRNQNPQIWRRRICHVDLESRRLDNPPEGGSTTMLVGEADRDNPAFVSEEAVLKRAVDGVEDMVVVLIDQLVGHAHRPVPGLDEYLLSRR